MTDNPASPEDTAFRELLTELTGRIDRLERAAHFGGGKTVSDLAGSVSGLHRHLTRQTEPRIEVLNQSLHRLKGELISMRLDPEESLAFNGQYSKHRIWRELVQEIRFAALCETGTFKGRTTEFLARFGMPVFTTEINAAFLEEAASRLSGLPNVRTSLLDSRAFLREHEAAFRDVSPIFYYLDAHWGDDLPLREEVEIIAGWPSQAVIMIDDFRIEDDPGYRYDDYGKAGDVSRAYLAESLERLQFALFYPSLNSAFDHMWPACIPPCGTAVISRDADLVAVLDKCASLRRVG